MVWAAARQAGTARSRRARKARGPARARRRRKRKRGPGRARERQAAARAGFRPTWLPAALEPAAAALVRFATWARETARGGRARGPGPARRRSCFLLAAPGVRHLPGALFALAADLCLLAMLPAARRWERYAARPPPVPRPADPGQPAGQQAAAAGSGRRSPPGRAGRLGAPGAGLRGGAQPGSAPPRPVCAASGALRRPRPVVGGAGRAAADRRLGRRHPTWRTSWRTRPTSRAWPSSGLTASPRRGSGSTSASMRRRRTATCRAGGWSGVSPSPGSPDPGRGPAGKRGADAGRPGPRGGGRARR